MPIPMPYYLEKGPFFAVLEDFANAADQATLVEVLRNLRKGKGMETFALLGSPSLVNPNQPTAGDWVKHLNEHWYGRHKQPDGTWVQPPFDPVNNPDTGYWMGYYGDVASIVRMTLIRTLEVVLGVDHVNDPEAEISPTRHWRVDFLWKCSQSWFEGWVTWHQHGSGPTEGQVTVIWATPSVKGSVVLDSPTIGRNQPEYRVEPTNTRVGAPWHTSEIDATRGMWVVTHTENKGYADAFTTTAATVQGDWVSPIPGRVRATGDIVTVAPSMADGGVLANGLEYQEPI